MDGAGDEGMMGFEGAALAGAGALVGADAGAGAAGVDVDAGAAARAALMSGTAVAFEAGFKELVW